ncbi:DUF2442 domain-containing protein [Oxalobacteraceae bacterium A2-2]
MSDLTGDGFLLELEGVQFPLRFADFPWFRGHDLAVLRQVEQPHPGHLYWPALDVDLSLASILNPSAFPLTFAARR